MGQGRANRRKEGHMNITVGTWVQAAGVWAIFFLLYLRH